MRYPAMSVAMSPFKRWFLQHHTSPEAICAHYLSSIAETAALIGASIPSDFLSKLHFHSSAKGNYTYLPDQRGQNIQKHSFVAFIGETGIQDTVAIPIIKFKSFKIANAVYWSPAKMLWQDFNRAIESNAIFKSPRLINAQNKYDATLQAIKEKQIQAEIENAALKADAHRATAKLALIQLGKNFAKRISDPRPWLGIDELEPRPECEFECFRSAQGKVYIKSASEWQMRFAAECRDMMIPVYNHKGALCTIQKITPAKFGKTTKRFIPSSETEGCFTIVSKDINPELFIIGEGYKTVRVIDHANVIEPNLFTAICAFSANNIPAVAKFIQVQFPNATILAVEENDETGKLYSKRAHEEINSKYLPIPSPNLFKGSDWADLCKHQPLNLVAKQFLIKLDETLKSRQI